MAHPMREPARLPDLSGAQLDDIVALAARAATNGLPPRRPMVRVTVWDTVTKTKISGPEAPTEGELCRFLEANPRFVIYDKLTCTKALFPCMDAEPSNREPPLSSACEEREADADR